MTNRRRRELRKKKKSEGTVGVSPAREQNIFNENSSVVTSYVSGNGLCGGAAFLKEM